MARLVVFMKQVSNSWSGRSAGGFPLPRTSLGRIEIAAM